MSRSDRIVLATGAGALVLAAAAAWLVLAPTSIPLGAAGVVAPPQVGAAPSDAVDGPVDGGAIVVDVQGGVVAPGVRELPAGSRVADAIDAAGGYAPDADLAAAADAINLAQPLVDGAQVRVPRIGDAVAVAPGADGGPAAGADAGAGGGLVDLNTATPEALEALPGIGPVTVQKIVAARQEQPFASLEDAVERGILNRGQLEQIQGLATAG